MKKTIITICKILHDSTARFSLQYWKYFYFRPALSFSNRSYVKQGRMVKVVWEFKGWVEKRPAQQPWFDLGYLNQALLVL